MAEKMAALLTDADGKLKPFYQWKAEVEGIASHYVGTWLRTEYNTAVIRAHNAADWLQFERNRDIMPNLRWMPTTSPNPEAEHRRFWSVKLTRPIDDPFWNKHRPGDRWNCKCSLEATDEPITPIPDDADDEKPQRGLKGNPAKTGQIFDKSHPYFPKNCASCGFNPKKGTITSRMRGWFNAGKMNCAQCEYLQACLKRKELTKKELERRLNQSERKEIIDAVNQWADKHLDAVHTENGVEKYKKIAVSENNASLKVNRKFFNETYSKNKNNRRLAETMDAAVHFEEWMPFSHKEEREEDGKHHNCKFAVYTAKYKGNKIEFKVKLNANNNVYTMKFIK